MILGGVEAGGTKMVCALTDEKGNIIDRIVIPTTDSESTINKMVDYFYCNRADAVGIASFGPIQLNKNKSDYGCILRTPKPGWDNVNMLNPFKKLGVPLGIDTDVNGAVLGEVIFGAAKGCDSAVYITIGTGIGAGVYVNGGLLHGLTHPESGHILMRKHPEDEFEGCCPFHGSCFEGLASGPAIKDRWGQSADLLYDQAKVWEIESYYIAQAITDYVLCYSPEKIILWGGVMHNDKLFGMVRSRVAEMINGYVTIADMDNYIVPPALGENPGVIGAAQLGLRAAANQ